MKFYKWILIFCLFALSPNLDAQKDSSLPISKKEWKEMSEGVDYTENYKETENKKTEEQSKPSDFKTDVRFGDFKYIFYFLVIVVIGLLIYWIFKNLNSNKNVKEQTVTIDSMTHIEENIHEVNLESLLNDALLARNYRIALRLNFLIVIKLLSERNKIDWAKEKTNWEYYSELKEKVLADQFKEIVTSFEIFWYGEHAFTELDYHNTEPIYKALQNQLKIQ